MFDARRRRAPLVAREYDCKTHYQHERHPPAADRSPSVTAMQCSDKTPHSLRGGTEDELHGCNRALRPCTAECTARNACCRTQVDAVPRHDRTGMGNAPSIDRPSTSAVTPHRSMMVAHTWHSSIRQVPVSPDQKRCLTGSSHPRLWCAHVLTSRKLANRVDEKQAEMGGPTKRSAVVCDRPPALLPQHCDERYPAASSRRRRPSAPAVSEYRAYALGKRQYSNQRDEMLSFYVSTYQHFCLILLTRTDVPLSLFSRSAASNTSCGTLACSNHRVASCHLLARDRWRPTT